VLRTPHFVAAPFLVARSDLVVTAPVGLIAEATQHVPLTVVAPPVALPEVEGHMVWHERRHLDPAHQWLRARCEQLSSQLAERLAEVQRSWALSSPEAPL
jgi:DNA-binding transcriptional LysR family regulator